MKVNKTGYPLLDFILLRWKLNLWIAILSGLLALIYVLFIAEKKYTAEISILPPTAGFSASIPGGLGNLTQLAGLDLGSQSAQSPEMFLGILKSKRLLEKTIYRKYTVQKDDYSDSGNLVHWLKIEGEGTREIIEGALKQMREDVIYIKIDDDNSILYLSITTPDPHLSAQVANYMSELLNEIVRSEVQKEYRQQLQYLENKLQDTKDSLKYSENELKDFLEKNYDLTIPEYQFINLRLQRNITINTEFYIELRKQFEIFVLENMINLSEIKILDEAFPPYKKSQPKRALLAISIFFLALFLQALINTGILILKNLFITDTLSE